MSQSIGIIGAGLIGRMLAFELLLDGFDVHLFDRDNELGKGSCAWVGAGMITPYAELDVSEEFVFVLGRESLKLMPEFLAKLPEKVFFQQNGSLILAHNQDRADFMRFQKNLESKLASILPTSLDGASACTTLSKLSGTSIKREAPERGHSVRPSDIVDPKFIDPNSNPAHQILNTAGITALEPSLGNRFSLGLYLPSEGQVDNRQLLAALANGLKKQGVHWQANTEVTAIKPGIITTSSGTHKFSQVIDCRGMGAKLDLPGLRGVRGEIIRIIAPEVSLNRPVRLMHPRYPIYITPRENHHFVIGATVIESEDMSPVTIQSALELLSAAFSLHSGFAHASILEMERQCRPALPDNMPRIFVEPGLIRINGLYRHGFLVSPKLVQLTKAILQGTKIEPEFQQVVCKN